MHSLFTVRNIDLTLFNDDKESMKAAQSAFDHLLPLSTAGGRIEIVEMFASDYLLTVRGRLSAAQFFDIKTITMWLNGKLKEDIVELVLSWLYTSRREDGASRVLMLESFDRNVRGFLERVREVFQYFYNTYIYQLIILNFIYNNKYIYLLYTIISHFPPSIL
jgi:hypothetical protein